MKKININKQTKNKIIIITSAILIAILVILTALYIGNSEVRTFIDRHILRKQIEENNLTSIDLTSQENASIYAYNKYITVLSKNKLTTYSNTGKKEFEHDITISDAIYASNNRFLAIAQKNGKNIYLISEGNIIWQTEVEGEIQKIDVNKNGYVSVIITGSSYKAIIVTYSPAGKELFKTYLSNTSAIDTSISNDNKYLAIAEINTSGTVIQSDIKIISLEKAQNDPTNSVTYTHNAESNQLITNIKYEEKNKLQYLCDDGIYILENENSQKITTFENKMTFASVNLNNYSVYTEEKTSGLFSTTTQVMLKNSSTQKENIYTASGATKSIKTQGDNIAINLGSEVHFINTNGWLVKKYISQKEISDIVLADKIAGIVYKDKIEIIDL